MESEKSKIINFVKKHKRIETIDVSQIFAISRQAAHKKLKELVESGLLVKIGKTRSSFYVLPGNVPKNDTDVVLSLSNKQLEEHKIFEDIFVRKPSLKKLNENIQSIFRFAFSEMLNNAIEHSRSDKIGVRVGLADGLLWFDIRDHGIGVFNNVMKKFKLAHDSEAIAEILKGKTTTSPKAHSGQGIFFTSKIADTFRLKSFGSELLVNNMIPDMFINATAKRLSGTSVFFTIATTSEKRLIDIFRLYESNDGEHEFDKTDIHVKLYTYGTIYVSRSQARRILAHIPDRFKQVVLDFDQVPMVGQAFADEIFRVFKEKYPDIKIEPIHMNESVEFMIKRAMK